MKVCVLFYGINRSIQYTHASIQANIFDVLKANHIQYDTYVHTYSFTTPTTLTRAGERNILPNHQRLIDTINPTRYLVERDDTVAVQLNLRQYQTKPDPFGDNYQSVCNYVKALHSLKQAYQLSSIVHPYDAYIVVRPDLRYTVPLDVTTELSECVKTPGAFYTPSFGLNGGFNDRFAIGGSERMRTYCNRFDLFLEYSRTCPAHSESFLKHVMKATKHTTMKCQRIRSDGRCAN